MASRTAAEKETKKALLIRMLICLKRQKLPGVSAASFRDAGAGFSDEAQR